MPDDPSSSARGAPLGRRVRLFVEGTLSAGANVLVDGAQAHYLKNVMRLDIGAPVLVFNGRDGEWSATVARLGRRDGALEVGEQRRPQAGGPDCWLLFAPVKSSRTDFLVEKATELGASRIAPVSTRFTQSARFNVARQRAHTVEAAEQCGRLDVPELAEPKKLTSVLDAWPAERILYFCDEAGGPALHMEAARAIEGPGGACAVLVGPEGGFDQVERDDLRARPFVRPVSLGPRVLRAETAALVALAILLAGLQDGTGAIT